MLCGNHLNVCKSVQKYMMLFLGYEKKIGDILLMEKKKKRKPAKLNIKVIMKSSMNRFSCYITCFDKFTPTTLVEKSRTKRASSSSCHKEIQGTPGQCMLHD